MEEEEDSRKGGGDASDPALLAQLVFVKMDEVVDYLKTLDYEKDFCKKLKFKPFSRYTGMEEKCSVCGRGFKSHS